MSYRLELKEEALEEAREAYQWYEEKRKGLGEDFLTVLDKTLTRIQEHPHYYPERYQNRRISVMQRYPYVIIFEIEANDIITVYAIFHTSRNPKLWKKRK